MIWINVLSPPIFETNNWSVFVISALESIYVLTAYWTILLPHGMKPLGGSQCMIFLTCHWIRESHLSTTGSESTPTDEMIAFRWSLPHIRHHSSKDIKQIHNYCAHTPRTAVRCGVQQSVEAPSMLQNLHSSQRRPWKPELLQLEQYRSLGEDTQADLQGQTPPEAEAQLEKTAAASSHPWGCLCCLSYPLHFCFCTPGLGCDAL